MLAVFYCVNEFAGNFSVSNVPVGRYKHYTWPQVANKEGKICKSQLKCAYIVLGKRPNFSLFLFKLMSLAIFLTRKSTQTSKKFPKMIKIFP